MFARLVAENATHKAELQRIVNMEPESVVDQVREIDSALNQLVISEAKIVKWQEHKPVVPPVLTEEKKDGEV